MRGWEAGTFPADSCTHGVTQCLGPSLGGAGQGRAAGQRVWGRPAPPPGPHLERGEADGLERVETEGDAQRILQGPGPPEGQRGVRPRDGAAPGAAAQRGPALSAASAATRSGTPCPPPDPLCREDSTAARGSGVGSAGPATLQQLGSDDRQGRGDDPGTARTPGGRRTVAGLCLPPPWRRHPDHRTGGHAAAGFTPLPSDTSKSLRRAHAAALRVPRRGRTTGAVQATPLRASEVCTLGAWRRPTPGPEQHRARRQAGGRAAGPVQPPPLPGSGLPFLPALRPSRGWARPRDL